MKTQDFSQDDEAVSPVIGVILMVAITVILAAVIGTFVLNLGGNIQENVQAGASISCDAGDGDGSVTMTWNSNQNANNLEVTTFTANQTVSPGASTVQGTTLESVGETVTVDEASATSGDTSVKWVVTAVAGDQSTVIADDSCTI